MGLGYDEPGRSEGISALGSCCARRDSGKPLWQRSKQNEGQVWWQREKYLVWLGSSTFVADGAGVRKKRLGFDGSKTIFMSVFVGIRS